MAGERLELEDRIEGWLWRAFVWCFGCGLALFFLGLLVGSAVWAVRAIAGTDAWGLGWHVGRGIEPGMGACAGSIPLVMANGLWGGRVGSLRRRAGRAVAMAGMVIAMAVALGVAVGALSIALRGVMQTQVRARPFVVVWDAAALAAALAAMLATIGLAAAMPAQWRWTNRVLVALGIPPYSEAALMGGGRAVARARRGECIACAYSMAGLEGSVCPECGARQPGGNRS